MAPSANILSEFWNDQLVEHGRQWVFLVLSGFVLSFAFIRMSTRIQRSPRISWWPGSIETESGVHVHHLVFGIVTMMVAGTISFAGFATDGIYAICAVVFGIGIGLTIDEYALWVRLDDVYWAEEGRRSIDATILAVALIALVVLGLRPFEFDGGSAGAVIASVVLLIIQLASAFVCAMKHRMIHALFGFIIPPVAWYGALRIGKPDSAWARRRYGDRDPAKQAKAERRFPPGRRTDRFKEAVRTAIGGSTESDYLAKLSGRDRPQG